MANSRDPLRITAQPQTDLLKTPLQPTVFSKGDSSGSVRLMEITQKTDSITIVGTYPN